MILPNKYISISESFIGLSALILDILGDAKLTIDSLWNKFQKKYIKSRKIKNPPTFQKYIYILEFMYLTNMITYNNKGEIINANKKTIDNSSFE
ncbi:ABC-three component system middle component 6 [Paenibacillus macerans]|uniref:ABC-three component system middle component 6 n=1 Tax=Paenibacillus macerans TaxID=44252 RepID=UPI002889EEA4|nr:ABC-three component system middle component 6 [Paenibacillus macerans]